MLRNHSSAEDSSFQIDIVQKNRHLQYSFSINKKLVTQEELREFYKESKRSRRIFKRDGQKLSSGAEKFGFGKRILESTRPATLILTKAQENNNEYAALLFEWLKSFNVLQGHLNETVNWSLDNMAVNNKLKMSVESLLKRADLWIRGFNIDSIVLPRDMIDKLPINNDIKNKILSDGGKARSVKTIHAVRDAKHKIVGDMLFDLLGQESAGTNRFFELAGPIIDTLENGKVIYIDEFETHLHQELCNLIVSMFRSKMNTGGGQLIINTHNVSLMGGNGPLKRDDIIFVEKSYTEESIISPLINKSVRTNENFEKRYREGLYGALPQLDLDK